MGAGRTSARWGVRVGGLDFVRRNGRGEVNFSLRLASPLSIAAGPGGIDRLAVMGPSGAGKSTFLNLLSCTSYPQSPGSEVEWTFPNGDRFAWGPDGPPPRDLLRLRRHHFGYAFQSASLQPHLTIGENLTYGLENTGVSRKAARASALERLSEAFAGDEARAAMMMDRFDTEVSGGERQRISLLQALMRDPYVLFADEPTGSLDSATRATVMRMLTDWIDRKPDERMFVWVTHHESDPADNGAAQRLYVADGSVVYQTRVAGDWQTRQEPEAVAC